jgi:hypothetical protein
MQKGQRRFVSVTGPMDMSDWHEFAWFKQIFQGMSLDIEYDCKVPEDEPIVIVQRPNLDEITRILTEWSIRGASFYILHISDEYSDDRIDIYDLSGTKGVVRNYVRGDAVSDKVFVLPLGFHWAIPNGEPAIHTPRPPFRELAWSFVGTGWANRIEKLLPLTAIGEHKLVILDEWNSPKMLGREENLAILLNSWFVPCPGGQNTETFRLYEALEAGAVPIIVEDGDYTFIRRYIPFLKIDSWSDAVGIIHALREKPELYESYRSTILAEWEKCKRHVKDCVRRMLAC